MKYSIIPFLALICTATAVAQGIVVNKYNTPDSLNAVLKASNIHIIEYQLDKRSIKKSSEPKLNNLLRLINNTTIELHYYGWSHHSVSQLLSYSRFRDIYEQLFMRNIKIPLILHHTFLSYEEDVKMNKNYGDSGILVIRKK